MSDTNANSSNEELRDIEPENGIKPQLSVVSTAGGLLAAARMEKNWAVRDIAEKLKLSPKQITALENNQFDLLPKMVIVRGFIRSYAKLLKIDAESILRLLPVDQPALPLSENLKPALSTPYIESRLSLVDRQNQNHQYVLGVIVLAVLIVLFLLHQKYDFVKQFHVLTGQTNVELNKPVTDAAGNVAPVSEQAAQVDQVLAPLSSTAGSATTAVEQNSAVNNVNNVGNLAGTSSNKPLPATSVANAATSVPTPQKNLVVGDTGAAVSGKPANSLPEVAAGPAANPIAVTSEKANLQIVFQQDSWIQIKSQRGNVLTSHLAKAGTQEFFNVNEVLQVRLGNAPGVKAVLRGVALDLAPDKGSNVANITVQ
jgi:cytoskeleton protein RodZ